MRDASRGRAKVDERVCERGNSTSGAPIDGLIARASGESFATTKLSRFVTGSAGLFE